MLETHHYEAIGACALKRGLNAHLQDFADHYIHGVEWEEEAPTLGEALEELWDRHENDKSVGWLDRPSVAFMKKVWIDTGIAQDFDTEQYSMAQGFGIWFKFRNKRYVFDPE